MISGRELRRNGLRKCATGKPNVGFGKTGGSQRDINSVVVDWPLDVCWRWVK
jgi:hypothetical protein